MDHTGMNAEDMLGSVGCKPVFTTRRQPATRLASLASYVRSELRAIGQYDDDKVKVATNALKEMF